MTQSYSDPAHQHAVTSLSNGAAFVYDENGNMLQRVEVTGTQRITLRQAQGRLYSHAWDGDNRTSAIFSDTFSTHYATDADGGRVAKTEYVNGAATVTDAFNTRDTAKWTFGVSATVPHPDGANNVLRLAGAGTQQETYRTAYALTTGSRLLAQGHSVCPAHVGLAQGPVSRTVPDAVRGMD